VFGLWFVSGMCAHSYVCAVICVRVYMCLECVRIVLGLLYVIIRALQSLATGWRRPVGCLKLQVIFRKRATNYWALVRKMTFKDKVSYVSSPPSLTNSQKSPTNLPKSLICDAQRGKIAHAVPQHVQQKSPI